LNAPPGSVADVVDDTRVVVDDVELADFVELEQLAAATHVAASSTTSGLNGTAPPASGGGSVMVEHAGPRPRRRIS